MTEGKRPKLPIIGPASLRNIIKSYFWCDENGELHKIYGRDLKKYAENARNDINAGMRIYYIGDEASTYSVLIYPYGLHATPVAHIFFFDRTALWEQYLSPLDFLDWCSEDVKSGKNATDTFNSKLAGFAEPGAAAQINENWRKKLEGISTSKKNTIAYVAQLFETQQRINLRKNEEQDKDLLWLILNSALKISDMAHYYACSTRSRDAVFTFMHASFQPQNTIPNLAETEVNIGLKFESNIRDDYEKIIKNMIGVPQVSAMFMLRVEREYRESQSAGKESPTGKNIKDILDAFCEANVQRAAVVPEKQEGELEGRIRLLQQDALSFMELQKSIMNKGPHIVDLYELDILSTEVYARINKLIEDGEEDWDYSRPLSVDFSDVDEETERIVDIVLGIPPRTKPEPRAR